MRNRQILGRRCWTSAWAPNGRRHASELGRRVDTQSDQKPGRALLALVERRRADLSSRGRLPRSLPPIRHGLTLIRRLLSQRPASRLHIRKFSLRPLLGLAPETPWSFKFQAWRPPGMQCIAAKFVCILRWRLSGSPSRRSYRTLTDQSMRTPVGESVLSKQRETPQPQFHWRKIQTSAGQLGATEIVPSG